MCEVVSSVDGRLPMRMSRASSATGKDWGEHTGKDRVAHPTTIAEPSAPEEGGGLERSGALLVIDGSPSDLGMHVPVGAEVVCGRDPQGLGLRDTRASRQHCRVWRVSGGYRVEDMGSTNGTTVNGDVIEGMMPLREGDRIGVGRTVLKFTLVDSTEAYYLRRMEDLARRDALTGLPAKHHFDALLDDAFQRSLKDGTPLVYWMLDLDGLKSVNDRHGHRMGAATIRRVGHMLDEALEETGVATRFGGDEFSVFQEGVRLEDAVARAERLRAAVEEATFTLDATDISVTISIGIAVRDDAMVFVSDLVEAADKALYRSKGAGRNVVTT